MPKPKGAIPKKANNGLAMLAAMLMGVVLTLGIGLLIYLWNPLKATQQADNASSPQPIAKAASEPDGGGNYEFYDLLKQQQVSALPNQALASQPLPTKPLPDVVLTAPSSPASSPASRLDASSKPAKSNLDKPEADETKSTQASDAPNQASGNNLTTEAADDNRSYILQINSFDNSDDADRRRAEVLMAGVDAQIVKRRDHDQLLYQVISRPMASAELAAEAQRRLQNSGIDSLVIEQRHQ